MKKILLFLLTAAFPLAASAYDVEKNGIYYNLNKDAKTAEVTSGDNKYEGEINIPKSIESGGTSYEVISVGSYAFQGCSGLTSVTIPSSVISIGSAAFLSCSNLTSMSIPNSVTSIGSYAFQGCSSLTSVDIPNSVSSIGNGVFINCKSLVSVTIPNSVTSISGSAFHGCLGLTSVDIPNSVTSIDAWAFWGCGSLTSVTIPGSVSSIGELAFKDCCSLTSMNIPNSVTSIGDAAFSGCSGLTSVNIPNSLTSIGSSTFSGCYGLTSLDIPNSVTSIGTQAFYGCSSLTSVTIPNSVTSIGNGAFQGCSGLTSIAIPNGVTSIGNGAFQSCSGLTSVAIPNGVTSISESTFSDCTGLTSVTIPNSVTSICGQAFASCGSLTSVTIPNSVTSIGWYAFSGCKGLTSIDIPNSVTSIDQAAFMHCSGLTSIAIPNGVTSISKNTFAYCSNLTSITISKSVKTIDDYTFQNCSALSSFYCMATEVPQTGNCLFISVDLSKVILHVPVGCSKYAAVSPWKDFGRIVDDIVIDDSDLFPDCTDPEIRAAAIYLYHKGIVEGEDGKLVAEREATRAEVAKTSFYGAYFGPQNIPAELAVDNYPSVYTDLQDKSTYYYRSAKALLYLEYGDGVAPFDRNRLQFEPEEKIARVNVLKELMEAFDIKPDVDGTDNPFPNDANVVALAKSNPVKMGYIRRAETLGIITTDNDKFLPYTNCKRGELFLMLARIMQKIEAGEIDNPSPQEADYFQPLNTTLKTIALGAGLTMGNFRHYTKTSLAMSGVVPLAFAHTYNSYNITLPSVFFGDKGSTEVEECYQPMGDGWSHNYHSFVTVVGKTADNSARAIVHWGGGGIHVYKPEDGNLVPESMGIYDEFTMDGDEAVIRSKSQMEYRFSNLGASGAAVLYLYSVKDRNGNELKINYEDGKNGSKRISSVSDGNRSLVFYYLSGTDLISEVKAPENRSITFTYFDNKQTGKKQLESFTDAEGNKTIYEYADMKTAGTSKLLKRIQLPKGNYIENEYDANMRLSKSENGLNGVPTTKTSVSVAANYGGDAIGTQSTMTVENGSAQPYTYHYTYNENNVATNVSGAMDMFVNSSYDNPDYPELPTSMRDNKTDVSDITYDAKGNVTSITVNGDGWLTTTMTYDEMNNLTSVTDPKGNTMTYSYDEKGNLTGISAPEDVTVGYTVNAKGLPLTVTNPMGVETTYDYNSFGNVVKATLTALGLSSSFEYDDASRLKTAKDPLNRVSSFEYNKNDFLTKETDPMEHATIYGYDKNGNLTTITNANGGVTTMTYDDTTDWLMSVEFAGAMKQYNYNKDGALSTFTKPDGTALNYSYDELGRLTNDGVNTYGYDNKLRLSEIADGKQSISFSYDGFNRITGTVCGTTSNEYTYDENGNCTRINDVEYYYDGLNRLTYVQFGDNSIMYNYRKDGKFLKVTYFNEGYTFMNVYYDYDEVGRLIGKKTELSNGTVVASYNYVLDKAGNIVEQTTVEPYSEMMMPSEEASYSYKDGNRIAIAGNLSFDFDANGNTKKRGDEAYIWDKRDRLTQAGSTEITYDPLGLIASYGDITFKTDPLGIGNVLSDSKSGAEYIYGNGLEARIKDGIVSYYVTDLRGSVVAIVDQYGNITHKYQYNAFGKVTQKKEADFNPFQYVGKYGVMALNDHLYYMRARHYDPTIGRFLSEDPIWSTNLYPYANNNPIMGIDPEGELMSFTYKGITATLNKNTRYLDESNHITINYLYINDSNEGGYKGAYQGYEYYKDKCNTNTENLDYVLEVMREALKYKYSGKTTHFYLSTFNNHTRVKRVYNPTTYWGHYWFDRKSHISPEIRDVLINNFESGDDADERFIWDEEYAKIWEDH